MLRNTLLSILMSISVFVVHKVNAHELGRPHIETTGVSQLRIQPDMAKISLAVSVTDKTAKAAKAKSDSVIGKLVTQLLQTQINEGDVETAHLQLQPQYRYFEQQEPKLIGYQAQRNITITVRDLTQLNTLLDNALTSGVNRVSDIQFLSSQHQQYLKQARQAAIKDAKQKAAALAKGFGETIDRVWEIRYVSANGGFTPLLRKSYMEAVSTAIDSSYQAQDIVIEDRVEAVFILK